MLSLSGCRCFAFEAVAKFAFLGGFRVARAPGRDLAISDFLMFSTDVLVSSDVPPVQTRSSLVHAILLAHQRELEEAVALIRSTSLQSFDYFPFVAPAAKQKKGHVNVADATIISGTLSMAEAVRTAISLPLPFKRVEMRDKVLANTVKEAATFGGDLSGHRLWVQRVFSKAKAVLAGLTASLRRLQAAPLQRLCKAVDFGLVEALIRASGFPDTLLVDSLLFGIQSVGDIFMRRSQRPVLEPAAREFCREEGSGC